MNLSEQFFRDEPWGRLAYDPDLDEFEAHVDHPQAEISSPNPISVGCLITRRCDLRCPHCYGNFEGLPADTLNARDWSRCFTTLKHWGVMRVDISGGEPTTRSDLDTILSSAADVGLNVVLSTNGRLLSTRGLQGIPKNTRLHISIDSGDPGIHEANRLLLSGKPSINSFDQTSMLLNTCMDRGFRVRVLTAVGKHNYADLLRLGEHLAIIGVPEWNISRVLPAGRALLNYQEKWAVPETEIQSQIDILRKALPWLTIRYSNRIRQNGYFLLVLPDGSIATQFTDERNKVILGQFDTLTLTELQSSCHFNIREHFSKWVARVLHDQPKCLVEWEHEFALAT